MHARELMARAAIHRHDFKYTKTLIQPSQSEIFPPPCGSFRLPCALGARAAHSGAGERGSALCSILSILRSIPSASFNMFPHVYVLSFSTMTNNAHPLCPAPLWQLPITANLRTKILDFRGLAQAESSCKGVEFSGP